VTGPWIILNTAIGGTGFNLRLLIRDLMAAQPASRKRVMARWVKDRDAEGETAKISPSDVPIGVKLGPRMKARRK
jgi:hypothetical protein